MMSEGLCLTSGNFFSCKCRLGHGQRLENTHLQVSRTLRVALPSLVFCSQNSRRLFSQDSNFCLFNQPDFWAKQPRNCPWVVSPSIVSSPYLGCHFLRDHDLYCLLANAWKPWFHIFYLIFLFPCWRLNLVPIISSWLERMLFIF